MQVFWLCFLIWVRGGEQSMAKLFLMPPLEDGLTHQSCRFSDNKYWPKVRTLPKEGNLARVRSMLGSVT